MAATTTTLPKSTKTELALHAGQTTYGRARAVSKAYYPGDDVRQPKVTRKIAKKTQLRSTITPGTVLILLAGRFRGKRVVFLNQLESGLLLVTGPFRLNGVPLRRVAQAYVIATSTKVDISSVSLPESINDAYFKADKKADKTKEAEFFNGNEEKKLLSDDNKKAQKDVDAAVLAAVKKVDNLAKYLKTPFGLSKGDKVHEMKF